MIARSSLTMKIDESFKNYFYDTNLFPVFLFDDFVQFLDQKGIEHREGKGATQVLQVKVNDEDGFKVIFRSKHDLENYTFNKALNPIFNLFFNQ